MWSDEYQTKMLKAAIMLVAFCLACGARGERILMDGVAARVNGDIITIGDVIMHMSPLQQQLTMMYAGEDLKKKLREAYEETLNSLIEKQLILQAYEEQDMRIPEWLIDERVEEVITESFQGDRSELMAVLARERITYEEWWRQWEERMIVGSMRSSFVGQHVRISPGDIRERYEQDREKYRKPEQVKLRMIYVKREEGSSSSRQAESVLGRLKRGEDFADVARDVSDGVRAERGGDWDWIEPRMLRREIADVVSVQKKGTLSDVIETDKGYYIALVEDRREAAVLSFEQARDEIEEDLIIERGKKIYDDWIRRLQENSFIEVADLSLF